MRTDGGATGAVSGADGGQLSQYTYSGLFDWMIDGPDVLHVWARVVPGVAATATQMQQKTLIVRKIAWRFIGNSLMRISYIFDSLKFKGSRFSLIRDPADGGYAAGKRRIVFFTKYYCNKFAFTVLFSIID